MKHRYARFAAITALATIIAGACVYEAGIARATHSVTGGVIRLDPHQLTARTTGFEIVQTRVETR